MNNSRQAVSWDVMQEILAAEDRIRAHIRETPLEHSPVLSRRGRCEVYLKLENLQITGSFKLRGAMNKILSLSDGERQKGIVTASSGNHGMAFAYLTRRIGFPGTVYIPEYTSSAKLNAMKLYGAEIITYGDDCVKAEIRARETAARKGLVFLSPYNDPLVIGGQGTIAIELSRELDSIDAVLAPVGGGGLIAGIAGYLKKIHPGTCIIGCQPENSAVMAKSIEAGRLIEIESLPTISDGTAGGIEAGAVTFDLCQHYVDDFALLTEAEIIAALRLILEKHSLLIEGAAALPVAAFLKHKDRFQGKNVVLIISGSKISLDTLKNIL